MAECLKMLERPVHCQVVLKIGYLSAPYVNTLFLNVWGYWYFYSSLLIH